MKDIYIPKKLTQVIEDVKREHPNTGTETVYREDAFFAHEVKRWAALSKQETESEAYVIPIRLIRQLVEYLCRNTYKLPTANLIRIVQLRANKQIFTQVLHRWLDYYFNTDYNSLARLLIQEHFNFANAELKDYVLRPNILLAWMDSGNVVQAAIKSTLKLNDRKESFPVRLAHTYIPADSALGKKCMSEFYVYCDREEYRALKDNELLRVLKGFQSSTKTAFMQNFLACMEITDFRRFYNCGLYLRSNVTGDPTSPKYKSYFSQFPQRLEEKYRKWLGYVAVIEGFGKNSNDERLIFWSDYIPNCEVAYIQRKSEALIMKFNHYCIVEFTTKTMGAIYVYEKEDFENRIALKTSQYTNSELRSYLYNNDYVNRIIHNHGWQRKAEVYLSMHRIAH